MSKQKRHKPEEIASILKLQECGTTTAGICRQYRISPQTSVVSGRGLELHAYTDGGLANGESACTAANE